MRCLSCSAENPQSARFCIQCANPFRRLCQKCGSESPPEARFCAQCGSPLEETSHIQTKPASTAVGRRTGERRHLTVLFCDLVGSTAMSAQLDPEEWREVVAGYHRAAAEEIARFGGHVAKYLGDGVMAYFGWPEAHDNDAERAARAGLAILDAIAKLNQQPRRVQLSTRIGIDSGAVVVGIGAGKEVDVFGDAPNIAARVETATEAGTVAITAATQRLVAGLFVVEDAGAHALKGIEQPIRLYRVIRPSGVRGRFEAASAAGGLTPFVGREDELRVLMSRWERVLDGEGQVALIVGEAGIGKSRLLQRFREQIAGTPHTWAEAGGGAFFQNTPFYPVTEMLRHLVWEQSFNRLDDYLREHQSEESEPREANATRGDHPGDGMLAELVSRLELAGLEPAEAIPQLAPLLNLPLPAEYPPSALSPEQQRRRLLATLVEWVTGAARVQPLVIATEDLHWVDPSTLELIQLLVEQGAGAPLLLLYTARPEFRAPWPMRAHHAQVTLNRLSANDVRTMVGQMAAKNALPDETIAAVVERTGGVPLFVEELTRAVLESGDGKLGGREIPTTLHDSLMARLDRLGPAKEVAQVGAVIGREFSYELLHAVHPIAEEDLRGALHTLADAELVYVRGIAPDATYQFKHALIQDAAYEALLKTRRKELHLSVARAIDVKFPSLKEEHPEVLARHWTEAGEIELAIAEWTRAGKAAEARNAFVEAQENYQRAVSLITPLQETPERNIRELELRQSVAGMLQMTRGWAASQTVYAVERIAELAEKGGNLTRFGNSIAAKSFTAWISGDLLAAEALADHALKLALRDGNPIVLAYRYMLQMIVRFWRGDLAGAEKNFITGLEFFKNPRFRQNPVGAAIAAYGYASYTAWALGRADVARNRMAEMMSVVNANNPHDEAFSRVNSAVLLMFMREYGRAESMAAQALELSEKNQFPNEAAMARWLLGAARAQLGHASEGIALIREGIATLLEVGQRLCISHFTASLAAAQERDGAIEDSLESIELAFKSNPYERAYLPEILRLRGELRLKLGQTELAEADFREAIELAKSMSAKSLELRATTSLARLLRDTARRDEARTMLSDIYGWFTEGFDTADLKDAKALLDQLDGYLE
jgi:class 3 adenylate cyclase/tetratricopeptide (TPR) repeat protein